MSDFPFNIYFPLESKYMSLAAFSGVKDELILVNTDDKEIQTYAIAICSCSNRVDVFASSRFAIQSTVCFSYHGSQCFYFKRAMIKVCQICQVFWKNKMS